MYQSKRLQNRFQGGCSQQPTVCRDKGVSLQSKIVNPQRVRDLALRLWLAEFSRSAPPVSHRRYAFADCTVNAHLRILAKRQRDDVARPHMPAVEHGEILLLCVYSEILDELCDRYKWLC